MRIGVVGAGSLGMLFAARLAKAGVQVHLISRTQSQAAFIQHEGIQVRMYREEDVGVHAVSSFGELSTELQGLPWQVDIVLVMLKQTALSDDVLSGMASWIPQTAPIVCFQNGIGHLERMHAFMPLHAIYGAVTTEGSRRISDGEVAHTGQGLTVFGLWRDSVANGDATAASRLLQALIDAGFQAEMTMEISFQLWRKLMINAVINPLTTVLRVANGNLLSSSHTLQLMRDMYEEAVLTAKLDGVNFGEEMWLDILDVCQRTAANHSSMLQDLTAGRRTEIEWITGGIIHLADKHGIAIPTQTAFYRLVKSLDKGE